MSLSSSTRFAVWTWFVVTTLFFWVLLFSAIFGVAWTCVCRVDGCDDEEREKIRRLSSDNLWACLFLASLTVLMKYRVRSLPECEGLTDTQILMLVVDPPQSKFP